MLIPPKYSLNSTITKLISQIEASKEIIDSVNIPPEVETNIRRQSTLKTSLFSARIEGNSLTLQDLQNNPSKSQQKAEVFNLLKALGFIHYKRKRDITVIDMLKMHKIAMEGLMDYDQLGKLRREMSATFNSAGIAVYLHPPPRQIEGLITRLFKFMNSDKEPLVPVRAVLAHYTFEKIHPFLDGNGRVGRLVLQKILAQGGYWMKGLLSLEEYLDNHRSQYYRALEDPEKDVTEYVEFMLEAIADTSLKARILVTQKQQLEVTDYLLPRRAEIYQIIKEHKLINFDSIKRRFLAVNDRTLRYDLKQLQDQGLVRKRGTTKGVYYEVVG